MSTKKNIKNKLNLRNQNIKLTGIILIFLCSALGLYLDHTLAIKVNHSNDLKSQRDYVLVLKDELIRYLSPLLDKANRLIEAKSLNITINNTIDSTKPDSIKLLSSELKSANSIFDSLCQKLESLTEGYNALKINTKDTIVYAFVIDDEGVVKPKYSWLKRIFKSIKYFLFGSKNDERQIALKYTDKDKDENLRQVLSKTITQLNNLHTPSAAATAQSDDPPIKVDNPGATEIYLPTTDTLTNLIPPPIETTVSNDIPNKDVIRIQKLLNNKTWEGYVFLKKNNKINPTFIFRNSVCETDYFNQKYKNKKDIPWDKFIYRIEYHQKYYASLVLYKNPSDRDCKMNCAI